MATVLVIDASTSVRETLRIVLGHEHDVSVAGSVDQVAAGPPPDIIVLGLPPPPRDEGALGQALTRMAPDAPVLLLHAPGDAAVDQLVPAHRAVDFLAKPFDAYALRGRVRQLLRTVRSGPLAAEIVEAHRRYLEFPYLSHAASAIARRAVVSAIPVLLQDEPGSGAAAVARALHVLRGGRGALTMLDAARLAAGDLERCVPVGKRGTVGTLYLGNLDRAVSDVQRELLELVQSSAVVRPTMLHIVAAARADLGEGAAAGTFLPELAYVMTTLPIPLTPLRDRRDDIAALVDALTVGLTARLQLDPVTYTPAALERLTDYLWFGNTAELEAVLARTLALHQPRVVQPEHLVFLPEDAPRAIAGRVGAATRRAVVVTAREPLASPNLEVVLGELAHELRNPMVTIKTFAQHLDSVLADPEARVRFSALTTDAIGRMDALLETLLDFARFRAPALQPTDVRAILDRVVAEHAEELARRHVTVERNGVGVGAVDVDETQVRFAFRSLLAGLARDLIPHTPLRIRGAEPGIIEMQVRTEASIAARLAAYVEPGTDGLATEAPPLAWALAAALLQRNGATLTARSGDAGTTVIRVEWVRGSG